MKSWYMITLDSLQNLWQDFISYLPKIVGALVVVIVGWLVAVGIGKIVTEILRRIKFDTLFEKGVWKNALQKAEWKIDPSGFIGAIVKWVLFVSFLIAAVEILGFVQFAIFVGKIAAWLPNIIVAAAIFVVAVIVAEYFPKIIRAGVEGLEIKYSSLLETLARGAIWIFAILAILMQLGIAEDLIMTLFTGFVAFLVIAGGLAFGLGGKEFAAEFLEDIKKKMKEKE